MVDIDIIMFTILFMIFALFIYINIVAKSSIFGILAGLIILMTGLFLLIYDFEIPSGNVKITEVGENNITITQENFTYIKAKDKYHINPINFISMLFIGISFYLVYRNVLRIT